jgi:hypothetical protein
MIKKIKENISIFVKEQNLQTSKIDNQRYIKITIIFQIKSNKKLQYNN